MILSEATRLLEPSLRWVLRALAGAVLGLVATILLYGLAAWLLGHIPVNRGYQPVAAGIPVYLASNGQHIDIVLPVNDCRCSAQQAPVLAVLERPFDSGTPRSQWQWVAAGWGDEQFMLNVPTWNELTPGIALRAVTGLDGSVLRLSSFAEPRPGVKTTRLLLSPEQYEKLARYIRVSIAQPVQEKTGRVAAADDRFYGARDSYNLFNTCNEWVRKGLVQAGIRAPLWTPFDNALLRGAG